MTLLGPSSLLCYTHSHVYSYMQRQATASFLVLPENKWIWSFKSRYKQAHKKATHNQGLSYPRSLSHLISPQCILDSCSSRYWQGTRPLSYVLPTSMASTQRTPSKESLRSYFVFMGAYAPSLPLLLSLPGPADHAS